MFKVNNKDTRTTPMPQWTYIIPCSRVSIIKFEQVNAHWRVQLGKWIQYFFTNRHFLEGRNTDRQHIKKFFGKILKIFLMNLSIVLRREAVLFRAPVNSCFRADWPFVLNVVWYFGYHYFTILFSKAWTQIIRRFKSYLRCVEGLQWWEPLIVDPAWNNV